MMAQGGKSAVGSNTLMFKYVLAECYGIGKKRMGNADKIVYIGKFWLLEN